jgi:type II secretory pathway component PulC
VESSRGLVWRDALAEPQRWLLGACLLVVLALVVRELWTGISAAFYHPSISAAAGTAPGQEQDLVERITGANLFGHAPQTPQQGDQSLPQTNLQLTLRGVFTATNPNLASAIIESGDGKALVLRVGASVAPDTVLHQVHANRVVLSRNGSMENLFFPAPQEGESGPAVSQDSGPSVADGETDTMPAESDGAAAVSGEDLNADQKRANILRRLEELRMRSSR